MSLSADERKAVVGYRIEKCAQALQEARDVYRLGHHTLAIQRLYYAAYYVASALLITRGIEAHSHAGIKVMLNKEYVQTGLLPKELGKVYSNLLQMRHTGDYDDIFDFTADDVEKYLPLTERLTEELIKLIRNNNV